MSSGTNGGVTAGRDENREGEGLRSTPLRNEEMMILTILDVVDIEAFEEGMGQNFICATLGTQTLGIFANQPMIDNS